MVLGKNQHELMAFSGNLDGNLVDNKFRLLGKKKLT